MQKVSYRPIRSFWVWEEALESSAGRKISINLRRILAALSAFLALELTLPSRGQLGIEASREGLP